MDFTNYCLHINTIIEDTRSATTVCIQCNRVLESNSAYTDSTTWQEIEEEPSCHTYNFIHDSCDRMHLPLAVVQRIYHQYKKFQKKKSFEKINREVLAAYSIYYYLKHENIGRTIESIARFTGVDSNKIWRCELSD